MPSDLHLVFDAPEIEAPIAKKFRLIPELHASGSGQFSADEFPKILRAIPVDRRDVWVIDLRQESHGFVDGLPVSWIADANAANSNKTAMQIAREEKSLLQELGKQKTITVYDLKKIGNGKFAVENPVKMIPESIETEEELVTSFNAHYVRMYVLDHNRPDDAEVDVFVEFIKKVKGEDWLHFHCRGGKGRSSTFIAMYDIVRNARNASFIEIISRQDQNGNIRLNNLKLNVDKMWKVSSSQERYAFLREFYAYVRDPQGYQERSWSAWCKLQG